jgi:CHAT domain-containing protein
MKNYFRFSFIGLTLISLSLSLIINIFTPVNATIENNTSPQKLEQIKAFNNEHNFLNSCINNLRDCYLKQNKENNIKELLSPRDFLDKGLNLYQGGRYASAITIWQEALAGYEIEKDLFYQALTLNYLSLAYLELGQLTTGQTAIEQSLQLLSDIPNSASILPQILNSQGSLFFAMGETYKALNTWKEAESAYITIGDEMGKLGTQINQAQSLQTLGFYRDSQELLTKINQSLQSQPDSLIKALGLRSLGVTLQNIGDLGESLKVLEQSLNITQSLNLPVENSTTLFNLGNTAKTLEKDDLAFNYYQQAINLTPIGLLKLEAQINQIAILAKRKNWEQIEQLLPEIQININQLSPSRALIYAETNLAQILIKMGNNSKFSTSENIAQLLTKSIQKSREIEDAQTESYSLGMLGSLYEKNQQFPEAKRLTQEALKLAQSINASSIIYQWQWQLGRILKKEGNTQGAIAVYSSAVQIVQSLRGDLVTTNPGVQFSFRDGVEPIYRELVALLLTPSPENINNLHTKEDIKNQISQDNLIKAREVIESLQIAELENFFREACLNAISKNIEEIDPKAAVIYPIILADRLAVILSMPGGKLSYSVTELPQEEIEENIEVLLESLNPAFSDQIRLNVSQKLYNWLIKPSEDQLKRQGIETLVFVLDGALRNIPMTALYDGKQYLIEKYQVAITPGLRLLEPKSISQKGLSAVMAGLSESRQGFSALPGVETEIDQISANILSAILLNEDFTKEKLEAQIQKTPFPILHLATHGQFSSFPSQTFIITYDYQLEINDFKRMISLREMANLSPIELLILSACETASGDKNAALGLAGMAVQSGARSTIATLWAVKDQSTALLMTKFYEYLAQTSPNISKAKALQKAQIDLLNSEEFNHPFYWSPFILVGNWL